MINPQIKIHDNFSIELKVGFSPDSRTEDISEFKINTWMFVPNSLDINRYTYSKAQFYQDVKNNQRLITPVYTLQGILHERYGPIHRLQNSIETLLQDIHNKDKTENYVYQVKMFSCIFKSALRTEVELIQKVTEDSVLSDKISLYVQSVREITARYRNLYSRVENSSLNDKQRHYFLFGDEFIGNIVEQYTFKILLSLKNKPVYSTIQPLLTGLLNEEFSHKRTMGFQVPIEGDEEHNKLVIIKRNILKKFVESDLYLQTIKKKDGAFTEQLLYSIAAGVAMIFATMISFFATQRYGNFTTDLFIILVVSYMMKDRIKEMMRYYFSSHMSRRYFDNKRRLKIRGREIGWTKESFDFITDPKVPEEILNLRNKSPLVEAENEFYDEKIILYRKLVHLSRKDIEQYKQYRLLGINDITIFNLVHFVQKMDNPEHLLYLPDETLGYKTTKGYREYPIYIILACESAEETYYRKYRLLIRRDGINDVSELD